MNPATDARGRGVPPRPENQIDNIATSNAAQSAFYAANPRDDARPDWDDLTPQEQLEALARGDQIVVKTAAARALDADVFEDAQKAWQDAANQAFVVAVTLRVAVDHGLEIPEYLANELNKWRQRDTVAQAANRAVASTTRKIEGD